MSGNKVKWWLRGMKFYILKSNVESFLKEKVLGRIISNIFKKEEIHSLGITEMGMKGTYKHRLSYGNLY